MGTLEIIQQPANAMTLERELAWAACVIEAGIKLYFEQPCELDDVRDAPPPNLDGDPSRYAALVRRHDMSFEARFVLILALIPLLRPQLLDTLLMKNANLDRCFTEFGGNGSTSGGFLPTVQTAAFLLAGDNLERRLAVSRMFDDNGLFGRERILDLDAHQPLGGNLYQKPLTINREQLGQLTTGEDYQPHFSSSFPAQQLETPYAWEDLVLPDHLIDDVEEIRAWISHRDTLMQDWQLARQIKPGFRTLFYGPPGTGKTLTATLLGKSCGLPVYRIDLSLVISKYIGETEKNLAGVFDQAQRQDWILFFDEADALFGKRTQSSSSNDRYANQEVAYLLQRVEDFPGVVILATNLKSNIDDAFARRFQSMIYFPMPGAEERLRLWHKAFRLPEKLAPGIDLAAIAEEFELSGGAIANVLRYACLMALHRAGGTIQLADIRHGIGRELRKEGKVI